IAKLEERIASHEEAIARREEELQRVRDRIASVPTLERRIKDIDSLLRELMIGIIKARLDEHEAELNSLNARINRALQQNQFAGDLQTRRDTVVRALDRLLNRLVALTAPPVIGPPAPAGPPSPPPGGPPSPPAAPPSPAPGGPPAPAGQPAGS